MRRTDPAHRPVRIGAVLEQQQCKRILAVHDRRRQHMRALCPGLVDVDARCQERFRHRDVAIGGGEQQRREAVCRECTRLGAAAEPHGDNLVMRLRHGPHQRGAPRCRRRRVDLCAVGHQRLDHLDTAGSRSGHQRRQAARPGAVRVGPGIEQRPDHRNAGVLGRPFERGHPMVVGREELRSQAGRIGGRKWEVRLARTFVRDHPGIHVVLGICGTHTRNRHELCTRIPRSVSASTPA